MDIHSTNIWMYVSSFSEEVTGSNTYVKVNWVDGREVRFVIDCGLFQETKWCNLNEDKFPYHPEDVEFAIATHFHADHIGRFPYLMNEGFCGKIYTTPESKIMFPKMLNLTAEILLGQHTADMAKWKVERNERKRQNSIGKKDKKRVDKNKRKRFTSKNIEYDMPKLIFTKDDVAKLQKQVVGVNFEETISPVEDLDITFYRNGHMLGAAIIVVTAKYGEETLTFLITGDYAPKNKVTGIETYVPQSVLEKVDVVLSESTYGSSPEVRDTLPDYNKHLELLEDTINNGKTLVYMTNAIERPLVIMRELQYIMENEPIGKKLSLLPWYFDTTFGIVGLHAYEKIVGETALNVPKNLTKITSEERDIVISSIMSSEPTILFLTSPQFYHGSFVSYAKMLLESDRVNILFCSYISECITNTVNLPKGTKIRYRGEDIYKNCSMCKVGQFSSHASIQELGEFLDSCKNKNTILFCHGTSDAKDNMVKRFNKKGVTTYAMLKGKTVRFNRFGINKVY